MADSLQILRRMYDNASRHYTLPDFETFCQDMQDEHKRKAAYEKLSSAYDLPDYTTFTKDVTISAPTTAARPQQATTTAKPITDNTAASAAVQPTVTSQPEQPTGWQPTRQQRMAFDMQVRQGQEQLQQQLDKGQQKLSGVQKGNRPGAFMGEREFNPQSGQMETVYYTRQGERVTTPIQQSQKNTAYHQWWENNTEAGSRSKEQRLQREFDDRLNHLWQRHDPTEGENAAEQAWSAAEARQKKDTEAAANRNYSNYASNYPMGGPESHIVAHSNYSRETAAARMSNFDLDRLMSDSWDNLGEEGQQALIDDCHKMLRYRYPGTDDIVLYKQAQELARQQSDLRLYNLAVEKNRPKSELDYLMRKIGDMNVILSLTKAAAVSKAGTTGDMAAYEAANEQYRQDGHKILDVAGMVTGFALDPTTWISGGVGSVAGKGAVSLGGRYLAGRGASAAVKQAATRQFATSMTGRVIGGVAGGSANFGTFEGLKEIENQMVHGGHIVGQDDRGRYINEGYSASAVAGQVGHGLLMGGAIGWITPVSGNVADKLVKGTSSTVGKVATRSGIYVGATTLEGTIFSVPEWIEGNRDAMDVWTDNMAMMVGFKTKHVLKSAGGVLGDLKASFDSPTNGRKNRLDFESRLRMRMDAPSDGGLALTKDERAELERNGYGDLRELVESAERTGNAAEGSLITENAPEIVSRLTDMVTDTRISEAARAKMYYYATGRKLPESTIMRGEMVEDGNGGFIVESQGANGVITSRTFSSRKAADLELERIRRQAELNHIEIGERYQQTADFEKRLQDACRTVAAENGWDMVEVYRVCEEARRNYLKGVDKQLDEAHQNIIGKVVDAMGEFEETSVTDTMRGRINEKYGVDIDAAIRKEANRRTQAEQTAIDEYLNELIPNKVKERPVEDAEAEDITNQKFLTDESETPADEFGNGEPVDPRFDGGEQKPIGRAVMKFEDRPVEVLSGRIVLTDDGTTLDNAASDKSIVIRDLATGKVEMVAPDAILSYEEYPAEPIVDNSIDNSTVETPAEEAPATEQPRYGAGQITIRNSDGTTSRGWLSGEVDEEGKFEYYVEGDLQHLHYASEHELDNIVTDFKPDAPKEPEAPAENIPTDGNNGGENIHADSKEYEQGYTTGMQDVQKYSDEQLNAQIDKLGTEAERLTDFGKGLLSAYQYELQRREAEKTRQAQDSSAETAPQPIEVESTAESVPKPPETVPNPAKNAVTGAEIVPEAVPTVENTQEQTPLQRIPRDEKGEPIFEQAETPEHGWDALVEFAEGDKATAKEIADTMAEEKRKAYEKAQKLKPKGKTPTEILASKKANAAELAKAQAEYEQWQKMAGVEYSRQAAIRNQQEAEARRLAEERAERDKVERAAREEAERIEREALEGIPEWHTDTPENARARGTRRFNGQMFTRQEPVQGVVGNEVEVKFSQSDLPKGRVAVIEAAQLQPSHTQGQRNPMFFIDEAQPKNRSEAVSTFAAQQIAEGIRPEEITGSATAYTGAPTVNTRGEVIQGNNRSDALRYLWDNNLPQQQQTYKQYLIDNAGQLGLDAEAVNAMQKPVLVNMLDVDDTEAIRLGQMTAQDTESGGIERIKPKNVAQKLGDDMRQFANMLLRSGDEEASFGQLVDRNGTDVLKWMNQVGAISNTQYQSAFDNKGGITPEAKNDLQKVLYQAVFKGGSQQLEEMFDRLPTKAQRAILGTAFRDMDSPVAGKMLPEIQSSIIAYNELMQDPMFAEAKNLESALRAVESFKATIALDDRFEQYKPADNFSNFALHLAAMYKASDMSQNTIASYFNQMYDLAQGKKAATLFEEADTTEYPLVDVIKKVLNIDYKPAKNGNSNVADGGADVALRNQVGQGGELRGAEPPASGEQAPAGTEPSDRGAGVADDSAATRERGDVQPSDERQGDLSQGKYEEITYQLSDEVDEDGSPFVLSSNGNTNFGVIPQESGLISAPIKLSLGNSKYGLIHLAKRHGDEIRNAGFESVESFVEYVANNFSLIREGENSMGEANGTYLLQLEDEYNNTLFVELSTDGSYWGVNSGGVFRKGYGENKKEVWSASEEQNKQSATDNTLRTEDNTDNPTAPNGTVSNASDDKVTALSSDKQISEEESFSQLTDDKGTSSVQSAVEAASAEVNTEPTPAQAEAGNYKKGHVTIGEFDITIENPAGSTRKGVDANGKEWSTTMANAYGYIKGTEGVDGDHIDVFLHTDMDEWNSRKVFVVDQTNPDGSFDEHKVMLGFNDKDEAMSAYLANYNSTWAQTHPGLHISEVNIDDFNKWIQSSHRKTKPFADYSTVRKETDNEPTTIKGEGYSIAPKPYTNKQGKTLDTYLVTFNRDFSKEELSALRAKAKEVKGWYDREAKGWMLRSEADAKAFAEDIIGKSAEQMEDEAPLSMADMEKQSPVKTVNLEGVVGDLRKKEEAKLSDHSEPVEASKPKKRSKWISDEDAAEFDNLRNNLRSHLGADTDIVSEDAVGYGNLQPKQMDAEVLRMGTRMTYLMMKGGLRKFSDYAEAMVEEVGDAIRPHLKSLYAAAQNMEEVMQLGWDEEMDDRKTVKSFDVYNFDKPGAKDIIETAQHVVDETESQKQTQQIIDLLKGKRNEQRKKEADETSADTEAVIDKAEATANKVESELEVATTEQDAERLSRSLDKEIEEVNKQLALLGYYEADPVDKDFNEAYGFMRNAEAKSGHAAAMAKKFNTPIRIVNDVNELTSGNAERQARMRKSKGFYDPRTGEVVVVVPNNANVEDVAETVFHEVVAHKGLRELIGEENYDTFCDEVYDHLKDELKQQVDEETTRRFMKEPGKGFEHHRRVSVDEMFGRMSEKGFEDFTKAERGIWAKLKAKVLEAINKFLGSLKLPKWVKLGDNELRYMLWKSHERLRSKGSTPKEPSGMDYVDMARDAAKREELRLTNHDVIRRNASAEAIAKRVRIEKLRKSEPVEVTDKMIPEGVDLQDRKAVQKSLLETIRGEYHNDDTGETLAVSSRDINEVTHHGMSDIAHVKSLFAIPTMLKKSIFIDEKKNGKAKTEFDTYRYYVCGLDINGEDYTAKIVVGVKNGRSYYDQRLSRIEKGKLIDSLNAFSNGVAENKLPDSGYKGTTLESLLQIPDEDSFELRFRDGETGDIWKDRSVGLEERITNAAVRLANNQSGDLTLRNDAMRAIGGNLTSLRRAMALQRTFDQTTVKRVADLARILIQNGYLSDMTSGEMQRLISAVKNAVGHHEVKKSVQKVMDIMVQNQLRNGEATLRQLLAIRGSKVDARGVEVQGALDVEGQRTMEVVKKAMSLNEDDITDRIAEALNRMSDPDNTIADQAAIEYAGLNMALDYVQNIANSKAEEKTLRDSLKTAKEDKDAGRLTADAYKQFVESIEDAIRKNKIERTEAYFTLVGRLSDSLRGSIENAKAFREAEKARINQIHHFANSDMEGRPTNEHHKDDWKDKVANNGFVQFLFAPLGTFDQIMRVFGNKSANGEGYLWNRFMRGWVDCRNKELQGVKDKFAQLDAKAAELFGKGKTWGDVIRMESKLPKATVSFWDGGEMRDHELTQGNLLYIYMVDKMSDGRMKLRRMGITEDDIATIENFLDPRFIALGDWLQNEFLVETRNEYNETHKRMFGASMAAIENYFPLKILANARIDKEEDVNQQNRPDGITTKTGSIIKRRVNNLALDITGADALSVILDHITQMEHWSAYAEWNRDLNTLRTYKRFRNQVINMTTVYGGGRKLWEKFNDLSLMAAGEYRPPIANLDKSAVNIAKGVTAAKVSFRMFTALKQLLSAPAYAPEVSIRAIAKSIANPYGSFKWCLDNLPIFRERWSSRISGDPRLLKSDMDWKMWRSRVMELSSRIGMTPNAFVDALTVSIGARAMYETRLKQYLREGYPADMAEERAKQDATILFNQTQQSSESPFLSTMQVDRSWLSVLFTVFRNSAMSYTRQEFDAMRNLKRNLTPGQRVKSVQFITKQILRDWNIDPDTASDAEHGKAEDAAKKRFRKQIKKDVIRLATFGFILEMAWNLGAYLPYIIFGNDDDEKGKMWDDAITHAYFGSVEGLTGGDVMSSFGNMAASGEWNWNQLSKDMPLASDINNIATKFIGGKNAEAINDIIFLLVQSGIGMNPQSITDAAVAITDACGDDPALSHEAAIFVMRVLQVPQSQLDKMYFDEIGLSGEEASKLTPEQLAQRYAEYKVKRGTPLAPWSWGNEKRLDKYEKSAEEKMKERLESQGDAEVNEAYADFEARSKAVGKAMSDAKELMKTDYSIAAQAYAELQNNPDLALHMRFKKMNNQLTNLSKMWLTAKSPEEAVLASETITSYRAGMVKALQAETVEAQQSAMGELTTLMQEFYDRYQAMQPQHIQVNR